MLKVQIPPEPSLVLWENLGISKCERWCRFSVNLVFCASMLVIAIVIVLLLKKMKLEKDINCDNFKETLTDVMKANLREKTDTMSDEKYCYCVKSFRKYLQGKKDDDLNCFKKHMFYALLRDNWMPLTITIINTVTKTLLNKVATFERADSVAQWR